MNADSYYEIGYSHKICEDYALSGIHEDLAYAIISDGCTESKDSDVGARLLCHIAKDILLYLHHRKIIYNNLFMERQFSDVFETLLIKKALEVRQALRLSYDVFDATLLITGAAGKNLRFLYCRGDGHFAVKFPDEKILTINRKYDSGAPYYLSYEMSFDKKMAYVESFGNNVSTKCEIFDQLDVFNPIYLETVEDIYDRHLYIAFQNEELFAAGTELQFNKIIDLNNISFLTVTSDGVNTYMHHPHKQLNQPDEKDTWTASEIIVSFMDYKSLPGEFVVRRMNRLKKDFSKFNWIHQDDISCATISL